LPHNDAYKKLSKVMSDYYELYKNDPQISLEEVVRGMIMRRGAVGEIRCDGI
jgi:hypothetical protein